MFKLIEKVFRASKIDQIHWKSFRGNFYICVSESWLKMKYCFKFIIDYIHLESFYIQAKKSNLSLIRKVVPIEENVDYIIKKFINENPNSFLTKHKLCQSLPEITNYQLKILSDHRTPHRDNDWLYLWWFLWRMQKNRMRKSYGHDWFLF